MSALDHVGRVAMADFLERVRRPSFVVLLLLTAVAAHLAIPAAGAGYVTVRLGGHRQPDFMFVDAYRGIYNSAWVGMQTAVVVALWLSLFGFYLIRGAVVRDIRTGVGQLVAATPVRTAAYTVGKFLSSWAVLAAMVACMVVAAGAIQVARGEDRAIDPWSLASPFLLIALPALAVVAAIGTLFDCVRWLRGSLGSLVYFAVWLFALQGAFSGSVDWLGLGLPLAALREAGAAHVPGFSGSLAVDVTFPAARVHTFEWDGLRWDPAAVGGRAAWMVVAAGIAASAALVFERFDPARAGPTRLRLPLWPRARLAGSGAAAPPRSMRLTPLEGTRAPRPGRLLLAEVRLLTGELRWWWYAGALGLAAGALVAPLDVDRAYLFPLSWIWALPAWSGLGSREVRHGTEQVVFTMPHPLARRLPAEWLAGVALALVMAGAMAVRLGAAGDATGVLGLCAGALAVPALALAAGAWTGNGRLFELLYLMAWYAGPWQQVPVLDFTGSTDGAIAVRFPWALVLAAAMLLAIAALGRGFRLRAG